MRSRARSILPESVWLRWHASRLRAEHLPMRALPEGRASRRRLRELRDRHRGETCAILGNGPSLRSLDLSRLEGLPTFCLNRGYLLWEEAGREPSYFVAVNDLVVEQFHEGISALSCPLFVPWICRERFAGDDDAVFVELRNAQRFIANPLRGVAPCGTVTIAALQLAFHMGFQTAILLGIDHRFETRGTPHERIRQHGPDPNHFRSDYFAEGTVWNLPALEQSEHGYRLARAAYEAAGRRIVNATPDSALEVFERADLEDALARPYGDRL